MTPKNQELYEKFLNQQIEILKGHFDRIMLRILNKALELQFEI